MIAFFEFLTIIWIVLAAGRTLIVRIGLPPTLTTIENGIFSLAVGLLTLAYGILGIGLISRLTIRAAVALLVALALVGFRQHRLMIRAIPRLIGSYSWRCKSDIALFALSCVFLICASVGVYTPPSSGIEWDSLAYHLADPLLYIAHHRIYYIPWESHSNFAFTAEMWYTVGLLFHSVALAKWFHWLCALSTGLAIYAFGARFLSRSVGMWAILVFIGCPIVDWEAGTAYSDLATAFLTTACLLAFAAGLRNNDTKLLKLSAILLGAAISTKATALTSLGVLSLGLIWWCLRCRKFSVQKTMARASQWITIAVISGCPWLVKSYLYTGNPIYPFYWKIFDGRYWNSANAYAYDESNAAFGVGRRPLDAIMMPWNLTMNLMPGHLLSHDRADWIKHSFNDYQTLYGTLSPALLAVMFYGALSVPRIQSKSIIINLSIYVAAMATIWFATAQYVRYLLPILPAICLIAGSVINDTVQVKRSSSCVLAGMVFASVLASGYSSIVLAMHELPIVTGKLTTSNYLLLNEPGYSAISWLNHNLSAQDGVVLYGYPLGFYCQRRYIWGDPYHSTYIPYDKLHSGRDLGRYLRRLGIDYVLIDTNYFHPKPGDGCSGLVDDLIHGSGKAEAVFIKNGIQLYSVPTI